MENAHQYIVNSHSRHCVQFSHGNGMYLYSNDMAYLDFMAGIAVNSLGHNNSIIVEALTAQAQKVMHISNVFYSEIMDECAKTICNASGMENVFFCNSGAEAIEGAIKMARKYFYDQNLAHKNEIITFHGAFHGRTIGAISSMSENAYKQGFYPLVPGFNYVEYGNIADLKSAINNNTAAILIEPIQGEGGLTFNGWEYLKQIAQLAKDSGVLLILDEVQCGCGRTGKFLASQWAEITPDIIAMAKGIGGGFPVGATLFSSTTKNVMTVGSHGTTFGGNPLAMAVMNAVCGTINKPEFLERVKAVSQHLHTKLTILKQEFPNKIEEIRGFGLMKGFKCTPELQAKDFACQLLESGLLVMPARGNVIRLLPPLIVETQHIDQALSIMQTILKR